jgi:hypothetical protein
MANAIGMTAAADEGMFPDERRTMRAPRMVDSEDARVRRIGERARKVGVDIASGYLLDDGREDEVDEAIATLLDAIAVLRRGRR